MKNNAGQNGNHLKNLVQLASFGGLFFSLGSTAIVWAGSESFRCSNLVWKSIFTLSFIVFLFNWLVYLPFRNSNRVIGHGLLSMLLLFNLFLFFGFSMFYFYFIFAPINIWLRIFSITIITAVFIYRALLIKTDIESAFQKNQGLFDQIYRSTPSAYFYGRSASQSLKEARVDRNPFKSIHGYAALLAAPFVFTLNNRLIPYIGDGQGVFLVISFFSIPILLWGIELFTQTIMTTIYYPLKLERSTGKFVLLKDW